MEPLAFLLLYIIYLLRSVAAQDDSIQLSGPIWMHSCQTADFNWTGGQPPYTFRTWTGIPLNDYSHLRPVVTNLTNIVLMPLLTDMQWAFDVTDANQVRSNSLSIGVLEEQCYLSPDHAIPSESYSPISNPNPPAITPTETIVWGTTTALKVTLWTPTVPSSVSYLTSGSHTYTITPTYSPTYAHTTAVVTASVSGPFTETYSGPRDLIIIIIASASAFVALLIAGLCFCWWRRRSRSRRNGVYGNKPMPWKHRSRKGDRSSRSERRNGSKDLLANASNPALMEEATPLSTPFDSTAAISLNDVPLHVPSPVTLRTLPSSKELRERRWESRRSTDATSISDISEPVTTAPSTSVWPENSEDGSDRLGERTPDSPHHPRRRSRLSPHDPRSLQVLISRELEQILQDPQRSASRSSLPDTDVSPVSHAWTKPTTNETPVDEKAQLSLQIPTTPLSGNDSAHSPGSLSRTPISRRDMEVLADMVAARLARDRNRHSVDAPPPSYS